MTTPRELTKEEVDKIYPTFCTTFEIIDLIESEREKLERALTLAGKSVSSKVASLTRQLSKSQKECENYKAMKDGVSIRIADLTAEVERLTKINERLPLTQRTYEAELSRQEKELAELGAPGLLRRRRPLQAAGSVYGKRSLKSRRRQARTCTSHPLGQSSGYPDQLRTGCDTER